MTEASRLIDEAIDAVAVLKWPAPRRLSPTRVEFGTPSPKGVDGGVFADAFEGAVVATAYPFGDDEAMPEDRVQAVADLANLIACTGVDFAFALDLDRRVVSMRNLLWFPGTTVADRVLLLRDLISSVAYSRFLYAEPLRRVALEGIDPAVALADVEKMLDDFPV